MEDSPPERGLLRAILARAALAGAALGASALGGATRVLSGSDGLLSGASGVLATAAVAFTVGLWAGAPAAESEDPPLRERWIGAGLAIALAGAAATVLEFAGSLLSGFAGRALSLFLLVAVPAYAVALLLPVLLAWGERREGEEDGDAAWGALGGLALGLPAGLVLGVAVAGLLLLPRLGSASVLLAASVIPLLALLLPEPGSAEPREQTLFEEVTPFGSLRVGEIVYPGERQPERRLYLNGEEESGELVRSGAPALAYIAAAERWLSDVTPRGGSYLFLGGGAYTLPRRIAERDPGAQITVVELDPEVTRVAHRFFGLRPELGIRAVHGDARAYLGSAPGGAAWDRIYVDVYGGQEALPYSMVTREAFGAMRALLKPGGLAACNVIGVAEGAEALRLWSVVRTFSEVFPGVALYSHLGPDHPDRQNFLLAGAIEANHPFPDRAGMFELCPPPEWPGLAGTTVFRDLYQTPAAGQENPPRPRADSAAEPRGERSARRG